MHDGARAGGAGNIRRQAGGGAGLRSKNHRDHLDAMGRDRRQQQIIVDGELIFSRT